MKKGISKNVVYKRVMVFATIMLFVAGALTPIIKKADATDDFDWAWSSGSGTTGDLYRTGDVSIGTSTSTHKLVVESSDNETMRLIGPIGYAGYGATLNFGDSDYVYLKEYADDRLHIHAYYIKLGSDTNVAGGYYSTAMGLSTTASGSRSTAMGDGTTASGYSATAIGFETTASGDYSTAMGYQTTASGDYSTAMGYQTTASGTAATAMGSYTTANGMDATAMGWGTTASGHSSTAMGYSTTVSGWGSTAMGSSINVSGNYSIGIGLGFNYPITWNVTDDNVMSVMGGSVGIGTPSPNPTYSMEIQGNPKGLYVKTDDNTYESIVGQCHHQYRPAGFVLENRYPASASFPKGVMMRFKGMDTNGVMQEYLAFIAEYVTRTAGAIDGDCWIRPVKNNAANWAFRFTHDGKLLIKDGGSASDVPSANLHVVGDIYCTGKLTSDGGNDPPYVLYNNETHQAIIERVAEEVPEDKQDGAVLFWNGETSQFEIYLPSKGEFQDIIGNTLK